MTWVKICGITSEEDALLAVAMGADALGFIFAQGSKRQVQVPVVADIVKRLPPDVLTIGVFRNDLADRVVDVVNRCGLSGAQLHGLETAEVADSVAARVPFVIKAFAADDPSLARADRYRVTSLLIDAPTPGSGETFDWSLVKSIPPRTKWILAGGLTVGNVAKAIRQTKPWGVDVASGVEKSPGQKDPRLVREFIKAAKGAMPSDDSSEASDDSSLRDALDGSGSAAPFDFELDG